MSVSISEIGLINKTDKLVVSGVKIKAISGDNNRWEKKLIIKIEK